MPAGDAIVTREKLLSATSALLVERASHTATVAEICGRAGVNVAMVKYCFGSKDGLFDALLEQVLGSLTDEIARLASADFPPEEKLRRHVRGIVRNYVRHPYVNRLMNERLMSGDPEAVEAISRSFAIPAREWYARVLSDGRREHGWREIDPTLFFFSVVGVCEFLFAARPLLERAFGEEIDGSLVDRYGDHVADLVLAGLS